MPPQSPVHRPPPASAHLDSPCQTSAGTLPSSDVRRPASADTTCILTGAAPAPCAAPPRPVLRCHVPPVLLPAARLLHRCPDIRSILSLAAQHTVHADDPQRAYHHKFCPRCTPPRNSPLKSSSCSGTVHHSSLPLTSPCLAGPLAP